MRWRDWTVGALTDYLSGLTVSQGRLAGERFEVLLWQRRFVRGAFALGVQSAALSVARANGKTALLCGAAGRGRRRASWEALPPGKSTLNRMELTGPALDAGERYKKIVADTARLDALLVDLFLDWHGEQPERIVLDVDATDDPLHGCQEGRFFHGYYRSYCYLPLYIFCGQQLLGARLRTNGIRIDNPVDSPLVDR